MEGLIPMMFKAIKRNQTRRQYRCLSNGASSQSQSYELFYDDHHHVVADATRSRHVDIHDDRSRGGQTGHRRFGSMGNYEMRSSSTSSSNGYNNFNSYGDYEPNHNHNHNHNHINGVGNGSSSNNPPNMEFKRNRSHKIFSCITGEAY